jgi:hypothetical protein
MMNFGLPARADTESAESNREPAASETPDPAAQYPELVKNVRDYLAAWEKEDFETMRGYENWEGGEELKGFHYMQSFTPDFGLADWKVIKVEPQENDEFLVLVWARHNPPKQMAAFIDPGTKVRSTLRQYWKKQDDVYTHLFHLEKTRLFGHAFAPSLKPQTPPDGQTEQDNGAKDL